MSVETILLVLLIVLVAGLLRSHAELLRRVGSDEEPAAASRAPARIPGEPSPAIAGVSPSGDPVALSFGGGLTLLAFLTSGCSTCAGFWETLGERRLPAGVETVIVAHGAERERPARLDSLAPAGVPVVMSSEAWKEFRVPGAPYFVLVDGAVRGEGVATTWEALASLVRDAIEDERELGIDELFAARGIGSDHPSLRPG